MRKLNDKDFLRNDKESYIYVSFVNKKLNQLKELNHIHAFFWKLLLTPLYFYYSSKKPVVRVQNLDRKFMRLRINKMVSKFSLRTKTLFGFDSLARIIVLSEKRIIKSGKKYKNLRNEINKANKLGYSVELFGGRSAELILDDFCSKIKFRDWRKELSNSIDHDELHIICCAAFNQRLEIVAVGSILVSSNYAYMQFYAATEKQNVRWLVMENLIETAFKQGVFIFHTDNLLDVSNGSYIFQKEMGYETVRLRFR
jgi:hypothetical protein